ncbi:50S ribosomal protein L4 [Candidatus Parcubacteria bacterium]|nr:MAG: 50S ribosomal protein L4 [Candidatus Parcubacteria bacterium]
MEANIYNKEGKKVGTIQLPESIFNVAWGDSLMHQVVTSMQDNARTNVAHTKDRGDVRGGGKKPWRQKGTGRARHGSTRSPIWVGGGVAHGPRNTKVFARAIPKNMRNKALAMALSKKFADGEVLFVESFGLSAPKTAEAKKAIVALGGVKGFEKLSQKKKNAALIALSEKSVATEKSFRNIGSMAVVSAQNLNPVSVLRNTFLILENPQTALATIEGRLSKKSKLEAKS